MSINKINTPYEMRPEDTQTILDHFSGDHNDWDNKEEFDAFKSNFRSVIREEQEKRCCFCKSYIKQRKQSSDIEHFIPKSKHSRFTFHPQNLSLSCKRCNSVKSTHNPFDIKIANDSIVDYPIDPKFYNMVHPHFHDYFEHIMIHEGVLIEALTDIGFKTVERCALYEPELAMDKAKEELHSTSAIKDVFMKVVMEVGVEEEMEERLLLILKNLDSI